MELQPLCSKIPPKFRGLLKLALDYMRALLGVLTVCLIAWVIGLASIYLISFLN